MSDYIPKPGDWIRRTAWPKSYPAMRVITIDEGEVIGRLRGKVRAFRLDEHWVIADERGDPWSPGRGIPGWGLNG